MLDVRFLTKHKRYIHITPRQFLPELGEEEMLWLVSEAHSTYIYGGLVKCLWGQNYQQWYFASTFTYLKPCDFFVWDYMKDKVYNNNS
jgi:hypothetical protein